MTDLCVRHTARLQRSRAPRHPFEESVRVSDNRSAVFA